MGSKIWDIAPLELKELTSADAFQKGITEWKQKKSPCKLCNKYVSRLGFITVTT